MKTHPDFILEKWPHGWLILGPPLERGMPISAFSEACKACADPKAVVDPSIASHYHESRGVNCVAAIGTPDDCAKWRTEIEAWLNAYVQDPFKRWWLGTDRGNSSSALFAAIVTNAKGSGWHHGWERQDTPQDADDFGRCLRLVNRFNWHDRLPEVALKYPATKWPEIVARWDEIAAAEPKMQTIILRGIHE